MGFVPLSWEARGQEVDLNSDGHHSGGSTKMGLTIKGKSK